MSHHSCDDAGTYTNTWSFVELSRRQIPDYVQTITVGEVLSVDDNQFQDFSYSINSEKK